MLRPAVVASVLTVVAFVVAVVSAEAAGPAPSPPPGAVNVQPAGVGSDGQGNPGAYHCGVQAGAAGNSYSAQPTQVSPSGASNPGGCGSTAAASSGGTEPNSGGQSASPGGVGTQQAGTLPARQSATNLSSSRGVVPDAAVHGAGGFFGGPLWIGLLLLLALLLVLAGFAIGRRRPGRAAA